MNYYLLIMFQLIISQTAKERAKLAEHFDGEIPKASNSTFGNCSGEGKNCPILLIHY